MDIEKLIETEEEALEKKSQIVSKYLELINQANFQIINKLAQGFQGSRVSRAHLIREKRVLPGLETTPIDFLISILVSSIIVGVATAYYGAKNPPSCPPMVAAETLDNPLYDRNWRVRKCPDNRSPLDKLLKPIVGVYR